MNKQELHQQWHLTYTWYSGRNSTCGILSLKETHLGRSKLNRHVMEPLKPTSDADTLSSKAKYLQNHPETYSKSQFQWAPWWGAHRALKNNLGSLSWHRISLEPELRSKLKFLRIWWSHWFSQALGILMQHLHRCCLKLSSSETSLSNMQALRLCISETTPAHPPFSQLTSCSHPEQQNKVSTKPFRNLLKIRISLSSLMGCPQTTKKQSRKS